MMLLEKEMMRLSFSEEIIEESSIKCRFFTYLVFYIPYYNILTRNKIISFYILTLYALTGRIRPVLPKFQF